MVILLQETRIEALFTENQQLLEQLAAAQSSATEAKTAGSIARRTASSLALQLEAATTELDSLRRVTAAATAEAAGYADWATALRPGGQEGVGAEYVSEGVKQRDAGLFKWFESRIMTLLGSGGSVEGVQQSQLMALTRQVRFISTDRSFHMPSACVECLGIHQNSFVGDSLQNEMLIACANACRYVA